MTRKKYDEYGLVIRNYQVRCPNPKCKKWIYITTEDCVCEHCGTAVCPDCLTVLVTEYHSYGSEGGFDISCIHCGYEIAGA